MADLGYRLLRCQWRKGLATAGALELVRYGFDDVRLDRIIAQALRVNVASRAVMERVGLTYVRTFPTSTTDPVEGVKEGEVEYEMTREQWTYRATQLGKLVIRAAGRSLEQIAVVECRARRSDDVIHRPRHGWRHSATLRAVDAAAAFVGQDLTPTRLANSS